VFRYLKAAFWAAPEVAGLGRLPVNVLMLGGFAILGFGHPGFWLLGMALEGSYLYALTSSPRFQKVVDAQGRQLNEGAAERQRQALVNKLEPTARGRLEKLTAQCARVLQIESEAQTEETTLAGNREALRKLAWLYLKALVAQQNLRALGNGETELRRQIEILRAEAQADRLSRSLRESKAATLRILEKRLANTERREQTLAEIESGLTRIEAQVDLAVDNAGMRGDSGVNFVNIELVSQLLDDSIYGESGDSIAALERRFGGEAP
jgi:hypothetical protein